MFLQLRKLGSWAFPFAKGDPVQHSLRYLSMCARNRRTTLKTLLPVLRSIPLFAAIVSACLVMPQVAQASGEAYSAQDIQSMIIGKRIYLATPMGGEFPLNYRKNGVVDGSGEALGLGRFVKPEDTGKWWIKGDRLCQQFQTWYKGAPMCFELYKTGSKTLRWVRDNGQVGTARIGDGI